MHVFFCTKSYLCDTISKQEEYIEFLGIAFCVADTLEIKKVEKSNILKIDARRIELTESCAHLSGEM